MQIEDTNTVEQYINTSSNDLVSYHSTSILELMDDIECPYSNVIYDYIDELISISVEVSLSGEELSKYKFRPDLLSYDIYGTDKFDFIILALNNMESDKMFDKSIIKMIPKDNMISVINYIFNAEQNSILNNRMNTDPSIAIDKKYEI